MPKLRRRIPKTVRVLPSIDHLVREIAALEANTRFLTEAEVLEAATQLGAIILAAHLYSRGEVLEAISRAEVIGRFRLDILPAWTLLQGEGGGPSAARSPMAGAAHAPLAAPTPVAAVAPTVAAEAAAVVSSLGGAFLGDDD